jgi:hypothetical protein
MSADQGASVVKTTFPLHDIAGSIKPSDSLAKLQTAKFISH